MNLFSKIFLSMLLFVVGLLVFLISTSTGLRFVVNSLIFWTPGLEIASISGSWRNLTVTQLQYQIPGLTVKAKEFHLTLDFIKCFHHRMLYINNAIVRNIKIQVNKTGLKILSKNIESNKINQNINVFTTSHPVIFRQLMLNNIQITIDQSTISLEKLSTGFKVQNNMLVITPTYITGLLITTLPKVSQVVTDSTTIVAQTINDNYHMPIKGKIYAELKPISRHPAWIFFSETLSSLCLKPILPPLPSIRLPLNLIVQEVKANNVRLIGNINVMITHLHMKMIVYNQYVKLTILEIDSPKGSIRACGDVELNRNWPINIVMNITLNIDPIRGENVKLIIGGSLCDELYTHLDLSGSINVCMNMKTYLTQVNPPLTLSCNSRMLKWPLNSLSQYQAKNIVLRLDGTPQDYRLILTTTIIKDNFLLANLRLDLTGNTKGLSLSRLKITTLQGNADLKAIINWKNHAISWKSELSLKSVDTTYQWPDYPVRLSGKIISYGKLCNNDWQLKISKLFIKGSFRDNELSAEGSLSINSAGQWKTQKLLLSIGNNQFIVHGELKDKFALDATIKASMLNDISPDLSGQLQGKMKIRGDFHTPQLLTNFNIHNLHWKEFSIHNANFKSNVLFSNIIYGNMILQLDKFQHGTLSINQAILAVLGDEKQHKLHLTVLDNLFNSYLKISGKFDRKQQRWTGLLSRPGIVSLKKWLQYKKIGINNQILEKHFIFNELYYLYNFDLPKNINLFSSDQTTLRLNYLDPKRLKKRILANSFQIENIFSIQDSIFPWTMNICFPKNKIFDAKHSIDLNQIMDKSSFSIFFEILKLNLKLDKNLAQIDWFIKTSNQSQCIGQIKVIHPKSWRNISGYINIKHFSLSSLKPLFLSSENIDGILNATLHLCGTVNQPQIHGQISLTNCIIESNDIPCIITDSQLILYCSGTQSTLKGVISTDDGQVTIAGHADWSCMNAWNARIYIKGKQVRVNWIPMVQMYMSPDIIFEAMPELFSITGKITIPWARIKIKNLPKNMVEVSSDEVILNHNFQPIFNNEKNTIIPINFNFLVHVGDDVKIDAFGLKAKLNGDLKVVQNQQKVELNGHIDIPSGHFHAYGQNLIVKKGQLLFSGPADKPYLNIEAIRNPEYTEDAIVAGIRIIGLLEQPKVEIFSDPIKSQQEILSYLLHGQGLETTSADNNITTSMLIGIGVAQSGQVVGKIGKIFGVKELALATQSIGDSSQVVLSGYLSSELQLKYSVGLFDSLTTLTLSYRLMPKLYLKVVSGLTKTLDFLYQFDF
ncbi:translocation/assembly module TamB domain-containing protein [Candidatus Curculioniphilus buchneri]|uniref:autotransporter assembly complex protein TamB n=1 Tax=Candidatus Curculioniphilus buchneri TaxID=690594 RepID=UPI00376EE9FA